MTRHRYNLEVWAVPQRWAPHTRDTRQGIKRVRFDFFEIRTIFDEHKYLHIRANYQRQREPNSQPFD